jgi:hypothetical protein
MKEYKVESKPIALLKNNQRLEDFLNQHAREGWQVKFIAEQGLTVVFEREKNR